MLDIKFIRENVDLVKRVVKNKQLDISIVDSVLKIDEKKRKLIGEVEELRGLKNKYASEKNIEKGKETKLKLQELEPRLSEVEKEFLAAIYKIPNIVSSDTPIGKDESENKVIRSWGTPKEFKFTPKDHLELGTKLGIIDTELAGRVVGTRFTYLFGDAVLLQNSLYQFALEVLLKKGFIPVLPPVLIKKEVMRGLGYMEKSGDEDMYILEKDGLVLVGTSEQSIVSMHKDEILNVKDLPKRYVGFSTCFRREAGSYGKDTRGILRAHQFDKIEMESFTTPEDGVREQNFFVAIQEYLMQSIFP